MRKAIRVVSLLVLVLTLGYLLFNLGLFFRFSHTVAAGADVIGGAGGAASVGIIGGADGPTAIFVTQSPASTAAALLPLLGIALPIVGLVLTGKK